MSLTAAIIGSAIADVSKLKEQVLGNYLQLVPKLAGALIIFLFGLIAIKVISKILEHFFKRVEIDPSAEHFVENVIKIGLWGILVILILANLGVNVSGLIAGLGVMGFIVGFALKDTLGNLAAGVFILFHKPFRVGHFVEIGAIKGFVEKIGIAATEIHTFDGKVVTIPNGKVWGDAITDYAGLTDRRLEMIFPIHYDSDMSKAINILKALVKADSRVLKEPAPEIVVRELAESSVNLAIRVLVRKEDYYNVKFDFNRKVKENFDKHKIVIPFPQREIHLRR